MPRGFKTAPHPLAWLRSFPAKLLHELYNDSELYAFQLRVATSPSRRSVQFISSSTDLRLLSLSSPLTLVTSPISPKLPCDAQQIQEGSRPSRAFLHLAGHNFVELRPRPSELSRPEIGGSRSGWIALRRKASSPKLSASAMCSLPFHSQSIQQQAWSTLLFDPQVRSSAPILTNPPRLDFAVGHENVEVRKASSTFWFGRRMSSANRLRPRPPTPSNCGPSTFPTPAS